jgi:hypothetical protein
MATTFGFAATSFGSVKNMIAHSTAIAIPNELSIFAFGLIILLLFFFTRFSLKIEISSIV